MTFLVVGADRVDAGKTTFTVGLLEHLDGTGFKPRAGNDHWFDHDDVRRAVDAGRLYGEDAARIARESRADVDPESINPVHRLWRPAPDGDRFLGRAHRQFVLDRVGDDYVVNARADVPGLARENLPLDDAPQVSGLDELNDLMERKYLPLLEAFASRIHGTDRAVIESYSDVARPIREVPLDRVAVVEPRRARIFDGERYVDACEVASGRPTDGRLEERVEDVIEPLEAVSTVELPALGDRVRSSDAGRLAEAYGPAYRAMV